MIIIEEYYDLLEKIEEYSRPNFLFRGQVKNFETKEYPYSFLTSFERLGCIPEQKFIWEYYCFTALKMILGKAIFDKFTKEELLVYIDALMQHYGWRSMQLDISTNIDVALFFAGFRFNHKQHKYFCEDCEENDIVDIVKEAFYTESAEVYGFLYIFDKRLLEQNKSCNLTDLTKGINYKDSRPVRQQGYVVSSYPKQINQFINPAIVAVLKINKNCIVEYCKEKKITQEYLFPPSDDPIYDLLISLPRKEILLHGEQTNTYQKLVDIPEYNLAFNKIKHPAEAFYSTFWTYEKFAELRLKLRKGNCIYYKCFSEFFHYFSYDDDCTMPEFIELMRDKKEIVLEFDNIYRYFSMELTMYQKGFRYILENDVIGVFDIVIDYVGKKLRGYGEMLPRYYKISGNKLLPVRFDGDCPCDDHDKHLHSLMLGKYFAMMLNKELVLKPLRKNVFNVIPSK